MKVSVHPFVQRDYNKALAYYEKESRRLAERFAAAVEKGIQSIVATPHAFSFHLQQQVHRRYKLDRFPYLILYRLTPTEIRITAIKHEKQRPSFGMGRR